MSCTPSAKKMGAGGRRGNDERDGVEEWKADGQKGTHTHTHTLPETHGRRTHYIMTDPAADPCRSSSHGSSSASCMPRRCAWRARLPGGPDPVEAGRSQQQVQRDRISQRVGHQERVASGCLEGVPKSGSSVVEDFAPILALNARVPPGPMFAMRPTSVPSRLAKTCSGPDILAENRRRWRGCSSKPKPRAPTSERTSERLARKPSSCNAASQGQLRRSGTTVNSKGRFG